MHPPLITLLLRDVSSFAVNRINNSMRPPWSTKFRNGILNFEAYPIIEFFGRVFKKHIHIVHQLKVITTPMIKLIISNSVFTFSLSVRLVCTIAVTEIQCCSFYQLIENVAHFWTDPQVSHNITAIVTIPTAIQLIPNKPSLKLLQSGEYSSIFLYSYS